MASYVCWGSDKEDLTSIVEVLKNTDDVVRTLTVAQISITTETGRHTLLKAGGTRKFLVTCSKGHDNVFEL